MIRRVHAFLQSGRIGDLTTINCDFYIGAHFGGFREDYRLAMDSAGRFGYKPLIGSWRGGNASRYIRMFQSRRSLLIWKIYGERLDGWSNDDFAHETVPGNAQSLVYKGQPFTVTPQNRTLVNLAFTGSIMPPPEASRAPEAVLRVIQRGLSREPEQRYASMGALVDALLAVLRD